MVRVEKGEMAGGWEKERTVASCSVSLMIQMLTDMDDARLLI